MAVAGREKWQSCNVLVVRTEDCWDIGIQTKPALHVTNTNIELSLSLCCHKKPAVNFIKLSATLPHIILA